MVALGRIFARLRALVRCSLEIRLTLRILPEVNLILADQKRAFRLLARVQSLPRLLTRVTTALAERAASRKFSLKRVHFVIRRLEQYLMATTLGYLVVYTLSIKNRTEVAQICGVWKQGSCTAQLTKSTTILCDELGSGVSTYLWRARTLILISRANC